MVCTLYLKSLKERAINQLKLHQSKSPFTKGLAHLESFYVVTTSLEGDYTYANELFCERFGVEQDEIIGKNSLFLLVPEDHEKCIKAVEECFLNPSKATRVYLRKPLSDGGTVLNKWDFILVTDDQDKPIEFLCIGMDVTAEEQTKEELIEVSKRNQLLLRELHHRVKNNLQMVSSMLSLKLLENHNAVLESFINETNGRIFAMSSIHDQLIQMEDFENIFIDNYLYSLIKNLSNTVNQSTSNPIEFNIHFDSLKLHLDKALSIGLLVHEIVLNAYKHAFSSIHSGKAIDVKLTYNGNTHLDLVVADNGSGFDWDKKIESQSTGLMLIQLLIKQLGGNKTINTINGTEYSFTIPIDT